MALLNDTVLTTIDQTLDARSPAKRPGRPKNLMFSMKQRFSQGIIVAERFIETLLYLLFITSGVGEGLATCTIQRCGIRPAVW